MSNDDIYATQQPLHGSAGVFSAPQGSPLGTSQGPSAAATHNHYYQPPQQRGVGCFGFLLRAVCVVFALCCCMFIGLVLVASMLAGLSEMEQFTPIENRLTEKYIKGERTAKQKIAIISVSGMIIGSEDDFVTRQIRQASSDGNLVAVVLRVESPGGTMSGSDYYHHLLQKMKAELECPVVVSMGTIAASGGYYVSMVGDEIYAEPSTITGSIGVIVSLYNGAELLKKIGVEATPITSGPLKTMSSFAKPLTEEERAVWQNLVDDSFGLFKKVIRDGRKDFAKNPDKLDKLATGQIFTANEAKANGLIDEIGYIDDAFDRAMTLAGVSEANAKVIRYQPKKTFVDVLVEGRFSGKNPDAALLMEGIADATTPKIFAICPQVLPIDGGH